MYTQHRPTLINATLFGGSFAALMLAATAILAEPDPITAEPLSQRHVFGDEVSIVIRQDLDGLPEHTIEIDDASHMAVLEFTIQPGAVFPWHTHPGTVLISITEGDFVFIFAEDCTEREYEPGMALVDPGDQVHTAFNPDPNEKTVVVATLLGAPAEGELTKHVDPDESDALDRECGIERSSDGAYLSGY